MSACLRHVIPSHMSSPKHSVPCFAFVQWPLRHCSAIASQCHMFYQRNENPLIYPKEELNVLIIGLDKAGKTTILEKIKGMYSSLPGMAPDKILPTVGLNVGKIDFSSGTKLILWDLGGQSGLQNIWDKYYADCHAILFVIDATDLSRVEEAKEALDKPLGGRDTFGAPLLVLANKSDQQDVAQSADEVASNLGLSAVTSRPHKVLQASGHSGQGIADGMSWLVSAVQHSNRALLMRQRRSRQ